MLRFCTVHFFLFSISQYSFFVLASSPKTQGTPSHETMSTETKSLRNSRQILGYLKWVEEETHKSIENSKENLTFQASQERTAMEEKQSCLTKGRIGLAVTQFIYAGGFAILLPLLFLDPEVRDTPWILAVTLLVCGFGEIPIATGFLCIESKLQNLSRDVLERVHTKESQAQFLTEFGELLKAITDQKIGEENPPIKTFRREFLRADRLTPVGIVTFCSNILQLIHIGAFLDGKYANIGESQMPTFYGELNQPTVIQQSDLERKAREWWASHNPEFVAIPAD